MKKRAIAAGILVLGCMMALISPVSVTASGKAESKASINKKAVNEYKAIVEEYSAFSTDVNYIFADINGDGIKEGMIEYHKKSGGSERYFNIFSYKNKKLKRVLHDMEYGLDKVIVYRKKDLVIYGAGHGAEWYEYFKLKKGKYVRVAEKTRASINGGALKNGKWGYYTSKAGNLVKAKKKAFKKRIKSIIKGKKKKYSKWKYVSS